MSNKAAKQESKFTKCVKAPFRVLAKARDFYVRSITDCSGKMTSANATGPVSAMPRSFSVASSRSSNSDQDLRDLIRAVSQRGQMEKLEMEIQLQKQQQQQSQRKLPRSATVGMGRIDEDKDFEEDIVVIPRSKSHDVAKRVSHNL